MRKKWNEKQTPTTLKWTIMPMCMRIHVRMHTRYAMNVTVDMILKATLYAAIALNWHNVVNLLWAQFVLCFSTFYMKMIMIELMRCYLIVEYV